MGNAADSRVASFQQNDRGFEFENWIFSFRFHTSQNFFVPLLVKSRAENGYETLVDISGCNTLRQLWLVFFIYNYIFNCILWEINLTNILWLENLKWTGAFWVKELKIIVVFIVVVVICFRE